jgi:predicted dehydrogenase
MPVKVCVIGTGHMGRIHAKKLASMGQVTLTGLVDVNRSSADEIGVQLGVPVMGCLDEILADGVQGAIVASTTASHYGIAKKLLESNIHVFVEKPITGKASEARELIDLARKKGLVLQVGHLERFSPPFRKTIPLLGNPLLIETRRTSGFTGRSTDIDVVFDLMIHDIDLVMSLKRNTSIERLEAHGVRVHTGKADVATARIQFKDGCVARLTASRASQTKERSLEITEPDRHITVNMATGQMMCSRTSGRRGKSKARCYVAVRPDPVKDELKAFIQAIRAKGEALVNGEDGLNALLIAKQITDQIKNQWK